MQNSLFVRDGHVNRRISFGDILYLEAEKRYVKFVTLKRAYTIPGTLTAIESKLPKSLFCRIHKSHIIAIDQIDYFDTESVFIGKRQLPIGRHYKKSLPRKVKLF